MRNQLLSLVILSLVGCGDVGTDSDRPEIDPTRSGPSGFVLDTRADEVADPDAHAASDDESCFLAAINDARAARGLTPLRQHFGLSSWARIHSIRMERAGYIYHSDDLVDFGEPGWRLLGENVGTGGSCASLHSAFMASPGHRDNILGNYSDIGIGARRLSNGRLYVTHVFMRHDAPSLRAPQHVVSGDFDGDGAGELALLSEANGVWWVGRAHGDDHGYRPWVDYSRSAGWRHATVGDFDGDGRDDIAVLRGSGQIRVARSTGARFINERWFPDTATAGLTPPVVGDFDGDGADDLARLHAPSGAWHIYRSTATAFEREVWSGATAGTPTFTLVGDYDDDGRDDVATYRTTTGEWRVATSTGTSFTERRWALHGNRTGWSYPIAADFSGDGRDDIALFRNGSLWRVLRSAGTRFVNRKWLTYGRVGGWGPAVAGDYNGDGRADLAVHRSDTDEWRVGRSTGSKFANPRWHRSAALRGQPHSVDADGDGLDDLIWYDAIRHETRGLRSNGGAFTD